jgi:DNA-binding NarL/FixJ family response regulator
MATGANGYILKESTDEEMANALREILEERNNRGRPSATP